MCLAIPGCIESIDPSDPNLRMARVRFGGIVKEVSLAYTPEARVGDYVIVHVGFAISRLNEEEAQRVFEYARQIGELEQLRDDSMAGGTPAR
jgi:hydrogenase expression/formation protein HypC